MRKLKNSQNILIDVYSVGILLLFMISGGYDWASTLDLNDSIESKFTFAETLCDLNSLKAIKITIKKCLMLNPADKPVEFISDLLPLLLTAKLNCEKALQVN